MSSMTTSVLLDGQTIAASSADAQAGIPTVIDDITVTWGRDSRLEQPRATTAQVRLLLDEGAGAADALRALIPGRRLTVTSTYVSDPAPVHLIDPSGVVAEAGSIVTATATRTTASTDDSRAVKLSYPPGPQSSDPAAWDAIPRVRAGQRVTLRAHVSGPAAGMQTTAYAVYYEGPQSRRSSGYQAAPTMTGSGLLQATITVPPEREGQWIGVLLVMSGAALRWMDLTGTWTHQSMTWEQMRQVTVSGLDVTTDMPGIYLATIMDGRISDVTAQWDEAAGRPVADVTAVDCMADLARRQIGDEPWPQEPASRRLTRILDASGVHLEQHLDPAPAALQLAARDVDSRSADQLISDLATSTGAVIWPASHPSLGPYLRVEDQSQRRALYRLVAPDDGGPAYLEGQPDEGIRLSASLISRDGITLQRDAADVATSVTVTWTEHTTTAEGETEDIEHRQTAADPGLVEAYGIRDVSISTDLTSDADAQQLATTTLRRMAPGGFTIPAATWDTNLPGSDPLTVIALLDSTRRIGAPIVITDIAPWVPGAPAVPVYLDGGRYTHLGGRWILELTLTRPTGGRAATWEELASLPGLTWARLSRLTWTDLATATI